MVQGGQEGPFCQTTPSRCLPRSERRPLVWAQTWNYSIPRGFRAVSESTVYGHGCLGSKHVLVDIISFR